MTQVLTKEEQEMQDALEEAGLGDFPEAPCVTFCDAYLKGFHWGFTRRTNKPISPQRAAEFTEQLILLGFQPSWNTDSNVAHATNEKVKSDDPINEWDGYCHLHRLQMTQKDGKFGKFFSHPVEKSEKFPSGWCTGKVK